MKAIIPVLTAIAATSLTSSAAIVATFIYNGHGYAIDDAAVNWGTANTNANAMTGGSGGIPAGWSGAHLANIESAGENAEILSQLQSASITTTASDGGNGTYAWIGALETATEGTYEWTDGTDFWSGGSGGSAVGGAYENWGSYTANFGGGPVVTNEPDNFNGTQNRGAISTTGWPVANPSVTSAANPGEWNDIIDTNTLAYVVEFNVIPEPSSSALLSLGILTLLVRRRR